MAANPSAALTYIAQLLGLLSSKKQANDALLQKLKKKAKVIDGVPYMPTGFEGKSLPQLIDEMNKAFGVIAPIAVSNEGSLANEDDTVGIATAKSAVEIIPLTACPTDTPTILPGYTKDEIEKVLEDISKDCETRGVTSDLLKGVDLSEAVDAKCDIVPATPVASATFLNAASLPIPKEKEPEDSLKKPKKTIVILNDVKSLVDPKTKKLEITKYKNVGESVVCGDPILKIGTKTITSPVSTGVIKKIYVSDNVKRGNKLFLIEETNPEDPIGKIITSSNELSAKIQKLTSLKETLGKIEPQVWTNKIIYGIFEGQYQGYVAYYKRFNDLVVQREKLIADFQKNKKDLKDILGSGYSYYTGVDGGAITAENLQKVNEIIAKENVIVTKIAEVTTQISIVQSEQPNYFALKTSTEALAAVNKNTVSGTSTVKYDLVPFQEGTKVDAKPLKDILKELANTIIPFSNDITLINREMSKWGDENLDINYSGSLSYRNLWLLNQADPKSLVFDHRDGYTPWVGSMKKVRDDFFDKATASGASMQKLDNPDDVQKQASDLRLEERNLPVTIENLANETYDKVRQYSLNFGYYQINQGSTFINTATGSVETILKKKMDDAKKTFDDLYATYTGIRKQIEVTETEIDNFPKTLKAIAEGGCSLAEGSPATAATIDGDKVNVIKWPLLAKDNVLPKDDDNYKGNPQPNSPPITELDYWKKYCAKATMVNLLPLYWPIGLLIPTPAMLIKIPLPIIWLPLAVIPTPLCVIVIGLAICGICPAPFVYIVNPGWPFPIGMVAPKASWFVTGIRGPSKIDDETTSEPLGALPTVTVPLKYKEKGVEKQKPVTIDAAPYVTQLLPLIQDDLPAFERLSLTNLAYVSYLAKWCAAGKKTMGFFENP